VRELRLVAGVPPAIGPELRVGLGQRQGRVTEAVDGLAEEEHLAGAGPDEARDLVDDLARRPVALRAARVRDDAEAAALVAALHRRDERHDGRLRPAGVDRGRPGEKPRRRRVELGPRERRRPRHLLGHEGRQLRQVVRADDQVHVPQARDELVPLLLREAAGDGDDDLGARSLERAERPHQAPELLLCLFAHAARVDDDDVGVLRRVDRSSARRAEDSLHPHRVVHVHLAAERLDVKEEPHGGAEVQGC
jgi:hypothetical protein